MKFTDTYFSREWRFAVGIEAESGRPYLAIPMSNRMVDYEEAYWISPDQYEQFVRESDCAAAFADQCRRREHDDQLVYPPRRDRGVPR